MPRKSKRPRKPIVEYERIVCWFDPEFATRSPALTTLCNRIRPTAEQIERLHVATLPRQDDLPGTQ